MKAKNQYNWDVSGILAGLSGADLFIVKTHLLQINSSYFEGGDVSFGVKIGVLIRRVVRTIISEEKNFCGLGKNKDRAIRVLVMVDVDELSKFVVETNREFLPIFEKAFPNIDAEAEMYRIMSEDYVFGLVKRAKDEEYEIIKKTIDI